MRVAKRYVVSGRVQGVGFRYFTQRTASRLGIDGWVRNTPDGSVEVEAAGDADALSRFERELRLGPSGSRVSGFEATELADPSEGKGFHIKSG